jgi:chromosomal replication initiation ATPase DnaA
MTSLQIIRAVSQATGIPAHQIVGPFRTDPLSKARFLIIGILREVFPWWSHQQLANAVGRKDPGQAMHALRRFRALEKDATFAGHYRSALSLLSAPPITAH